MAHLFARTPQPTLQTSCSFPFLEIKCFDVSSLDNMNCRIIFCSSFGCKQDRITDGCFSSLPGKKAGGVWKRSVVRFLRMREMPRSVWL